VHLKVYCRKQFWQSQLPEGREAAPWQKVLRLLAVNRLLEPGSEFRVHRQWFDRTAMAEWLGTDFAVAEKDRLYRCLDRLLEHKQELFQPPGEGESHSAQAAGTAAGRTAGDAAQPAQAEGVK
jgi:hypothetical protein